MKLKVPTAVLIILRAGHPPPASSGAWPRLPACVPTTPLGLRVSAQTSLLGLSRQCLPCVRMHWMTVWPSPSLERARHWPGSCCGGWTGSKGPEALLRLDRAWARAGRVGWGGYPLRGLFGSHTELWPPAWLFPGSKCLSQTHAPHVLPKAGWCPAQTETAERPYGPHIARGGWGGPALLPRGPRPRDKQRPRSGGHACPSVPRLCHIPDPSPVPEPSSSILRLCVWSSPACRVRGPTGLCQITSP